MGETTASTAIKKRTSGPESAARLHLWRSSLIRTVRTAGLREEWKVEMSFSII